MMLNVDAAFYKRDKISMQCALHCIVQRVLV